MINENKKINGESLKSFFSLIEEKIKIMTIPKKTKDKCLKKRRSHWCLVCLRLLWRLILMKKITP